MEKTMTASGMTDGQIESAVNHLRDAMRKHRTEIQRDVAQQALGVANLGMQMFAVFRSLAETMSNLIVRRVKVDRTKSPQEVLDATRREQYTDADTVKAMPRGQGEEAEVYFFNLGRSVSDEELDKEYELRDLKPADPYSLTAVNEADPGFADERPNATHWQNANGKWCYAAFYRWHVGRRVYVHRYAFACYAHWWFAGLRK